MLRIIAAVAAMVFCVHSLAQDDNLLSERDSIYINEVEGEYPAKVLHAEPLYIDLIRDLGARKGEHEWNFGAGITDRTKYDNYQALIEYEFAPIDRVGLEIELPFTFHTPVNGTPREDVPEHRVESLKVAGQWSFLVSPKYNASMALGYIHEFVFQDFRRMNSRSVFSGNVFNPFLIAAKRWGNNFHSLVYTGPRIEHEYMSTHYETAYEVNTSVHYMITGTRNFVGIEFNKQFEDRNFDMTIRPQLRVAIADNLLIGIVAGVPVSREKERFSSFFRLIWEPGTKTH